VSGDKRESSVSTGPLASQERREHVVCHYEDQLRRHGPTAEGMDWKDAASQNLRFRILTDGLDLTGAKVHDVGAGVGHLYEYLRDQGHNVAYSGSDLSQDMVAAARNRYPEARFGQQDVLNLEDNSGESFDFLFCSGLFHVKLDCPEEQWAAFVEHAVGRMYALCNVAISFNMMSDRVDYRADGLYHSNPEAMQAFCEGLGGRVVLNDDYPLYEYTVHLFKDLVKKEVQRDGERG
jgi:SAM-dependent methyltransferase